MFKNLKMFCEEKQPEDDVFNFLTVALFAGTHAQTSLLNAKLTSYMPGLTAKVFRTYNASVTLEKELKMKRQAEVNERAKFAHMFKTQPSEAQVEKRLEMDEARYNSFAIKLKDLVGDVRRIDDQDNNKLVALGTSKINYMDPRITVAWCKRVGMTRRVY